MIGFMSAMGNSETCVLVDVANADGLQPTHYQILAQQVGWANDGADCLE